MRKEFLLLLDKRQFALLKSLSPWLFPGANELTNSVFPMTISEDSVDLSENALSSDLSIRALPSPGVSEFTQFIPLQAVIQINLENVKSPRRLRTSGRGVPDVFYMYSRAILWKTHCQCFVY